MGVTGWLVLWMITGHVLLQPQQRFACGATTAIQGEQIEGSDPCPSSDENVYGSNYQVVASKPPSGSDFTTSQDAGLSCQVPIQSCGAVEDVEAQCRQTAGCVAFSYDGKCGYLKTSDQPRVARSGWVTYVLASSRSAAPAPSSPPAATSPAIPATASSNSSAVGSPGGRRAVLEG